ncbi:peritrophin-1-like [Lutzomyia longipalpis]|uniref:peritrophin-1-like n=1 Tax=Lutzomyia longipalpis TaxID=7200 RepID=UPI002483D5BE|nr:peritrophin-1-like [Lutzomyia longipalpis]
MLKYVLVLALATVAYADTTLYPCPSYGLARLPHASSCAHFVQCVSGVAVIRECAPGFYFSTETGECKHPYLANCDLPERPCPLFNDPENLVFLPDANQCDVYHLCYFGDPIQFRCADGLHWDPVNENCNYPSLANCQAVNVTCEATGIYTVPHPFLCHRFFHCVNGERFADECPGNLYYDITRMACWHPDEAVCAGQEQPPTTQEPTPIIEGQNLP